MITVSSERELGGIAEISAEFGVPRSTVSMWDIRRRTTRMPEPVARLASGPIYDMAEIRRWYPNKVDGRTNRTSRKKATA